MLPKIYNDISEATYLSYGEKYGVDIEEWKKMIAYTVNNASLILMYIISIFFISFIFNINKIDLTFFIITFFSLRKSWGGFHFENQKVCFIASLIIPFISINIDIKHYVIAQIIFSLILIKINVVDNKNRLIENEKKIKCKKRGMVVLNILLIANIILKKNTISTAILITTISCLTGKIKKRRLKDDRNRYSN